MLKPVQDFPVFAMYRLILILAFALLLRPVSAQDVQLKRVDPMHWWVGMKNPVVQLLVYGPNIGKATVKASYPGVTLGDAKPLENPNYLVVDMLVSEKARPGKFPIQFRVGKQRLEYTYELKPRNPAPKAQGVTNADLVYLILPDRFANGDPSNDKLRDMADTSADRSNPFLRHGGDLLGIQNHLPYLKDLGVTALWLNPVTENDQPLTNEQGTMRASYHGYGFTDHYKVDRRLGGNEAYKKLIAEAHKQGIKIIQDAVYNHAGNTCWFLKDLPAKNWLNQWPAYTNTSYKQQPVFDPYSSEIDRKTSSDGWFVPFLPDLNPRNPDLANYLIQNAVWQVEEFGIDAWRIDTYFYNDLAFMNACNKALLDQYPTIHIYGESWVATVAEQAYFTANTLRTKYRSNLPGAMDFQVWQAINDALRPDAPADANQKLYQTLAQDFLYKDATKNLVFMDNHDTDRFFSVIGEDMNRFKAGVAFTLTTRGIPQLYYGTEILMKNFKDPTDAEVRRDFPGGFAGDTQNKFTAAGRVGSENEAFTYVRKLANYRKNTPALQTGALVQFLPKDGVYVYFRHNDAQTVMVIMNGNKKEMPLDMTRFAERTAGFKSARNIITDEITPNLTALKIPAQGTLVLELRK